VPVRPDPVARVDQPGAGVAARAGLRSSSRGANRPVAISRMRSARARAASRSQRSPSMPIARASRTLGRRAGGARRRVLHGGAQVVVMPRRYPACCQPCGTPNVNNWSVADMGRPARIPVPGSAGEPWRRRGVGPVDPRARVDVTVVSAVRRPAGGRAPAPTRRRGRRARSSPVSMGSSSPGVNSPASVGCLRRGRGGAFDVRLELDEGGRRGALARTGGEGAGARGPGHACGRCSAWTRRRGRPQFRSPARCRRCRSRRHSARR
jgi:hypothetical protein